MIVSDLESLCIRLLLGAALDCHARGVYDQVEEHVDALLAWCEQPGVTSNAQAEIDTGLASVVACL